MNAHRFQHDTRGKGGGVWVGVSGAATTSVVVAGAGPLERQSSSDLQPSWSRLGLCSTCGRSPFCLFRLNATVNSKLHNKNRFVGRSVRWQFVRVVLF